MKAESHLLKARCLMLARKPWYGHAAATIQWDADENIYTMAVTVRADGQVVCLYGPKFVLECTVGELAAVIEHEIEHVLRQHCGRGRGLDQNLFNIACDMVVNGHQQSPRIGIVHPKTGYPEIRGADQICWLPASWCADLTAEQCYEKLVANGVQARRFNNRSLIGQHDLWETADADAVSAAVNRFSLAAAASGAVVPETVKPFLDEIKPPELPWEEVLATFVRGTSGARKRTAYSRRSRRVDCFGMPGRKSNEVCHLAVVVDTSTSVTDAVLSKFFGELEALSSLATFDVLTWSDCFGTFLSPYATGDWKTFKRNYGYTDMIAPVQWLCDHQMLADGLLMLTDGYCLWPKPQGVPFLVVCSSPRGMITEPDWGKTVYLNFK